MNTDHKEKRLLAICDLGRMTWCIGEFLDFQMETLINRVRHNVDKIDIIWAYNPEEPAIAKTMKTGMFSRKSSRLYLEELLPLGRVNQHLGSFMLMAFKDVEKFVEDNSDRYIIDPPIKSIRNRKPLYAASFNKIMNFYEERGFLPMLSCSPDMVSWARSFLGKIAKYPIVMQLRHSPFGARQLNAPLNEWLRFFAKYSKKSKPTKFIIICRREEITNEFEKATRALGNVVFSKLYGTTVEQDCALIQSSMICMGSSGIMVMARYCGVPYLLFDAYYFGYKGRLNKSWQLPFATPFQQLIWKKTSEGAIMKEFEGLCKQLSEASVVWRNGTWLIR